jgi:hypothetical protein
LADASAEHGLLDAVLRAARTAGGSESKLLALTRLLRRTRESALVFTEYRDTALHVSGQLGGVPILHGGLDRQARARVVDGFSRGAHRILIATDAGGQGLNLHQRCRLVINLELPWNPVRLEQRIGRVDRIGQTRRVHAVHFVGLHTGETAILARLHSRMATARDVLTDLDSSVDGRADRDPGARAEAARLTDARALVVAGDTAALSALERSRWWVVRARAGCRRTLSGRALLIYRLRSLNEAGGSSGFHLLALAVPLRAGRTADLSEVLAEAAATPGHLAVDGAITAWLAEHTSIEHAFGGANAARGEQIAASLLGHDASAYQPGLFDQRVQRQRDGERAAQSAWLDSLLARLKETRKRTTIIDHVVEPMLVIVP